MSVDFRPGDEIRLPFLIKAVDAIVDITGGTVAAELVTYGKTKIADLTAGNGGVIIEQPAPAVAPDPDDQVAHGIVVIDEITSAKLPLGLLSRITLVYTTVNGIRLSAECITLNGVSC